MYKNILVTLDATETDRAIVEHIKPLAKMMQSHIVLLHVADGWAARHFGADAVSDEVEEDTKYLAGLQDEFANEGLSVEFELCFGHPVEEIVKWVQEHPCDLVAMSTHGHKGLSDLFFGWTASRVQHEITVPVLMLQAS